MNCAFLEGLSLSTLVAPVTAEEFRTKYFERQPLIVNRRNPDYYDNLFTLEEFDAAMARTPEYVKVTNAVTNKTNQYRLSDIRDGSTLVLDQLQKSDPKLGELCRVLSAQLGPRFQTNLYLTPPNGKGFTPHYDNHDVFILQVVGSKHWSVEKHRRRLPGRDESIPDAERELRGELYKFVLEQGDIVYIPRGFVHAAECAAEPSLHITLGLLPFCWDELMVAVTKAAALKNEQLRYALPLGFQQEKRELFVNQLKAAFRAMTDPVFLEGAIQQYMDEIISHYPLDIAGHVRDFFAPRPVRLDDVLVLRRGITFRAHLDGEAPRVNYGGRTITFLEIFRDALGRALDGAAFAVRDLPGDLHDDERIAFAERLLQEGLLVHQAGAEADVNRHRRRALEESPAAAE